MKVNGAKPAGAEQVSVCREQRRRRAAATGLHGRKRLYGGPSKVKPPHLQEEEQRGGAGRNRLTGPKAVTQHTDWSINPNGKDPNEP